MSSIAVPFHFTATFVLALAVAGGAWIAFTRPDLCPPGKWGRRAFLAGWTLLALGEVMHGSLIAPTDLDNTLVALKAGAYGILVLSLLQPEKQKQKAAIAATSGQVLMPAALGAFAAYNAYRYPLTSIRRLAVAFGLLSISEALFGPGGGGTAADADALFYFSHALRLVAAVAIGSWLWQAVKTSLRVRFVAVVLALVLVVIVAIAGSMTQVFSSNVAEEALLRAANEGIVQKERLQDQIRSSLDRAKQLASLNTVREPVARRDSALVGIARFLQSPGGPFDSSDFLAFLGPEADILALSAEGANGVARLDPADAVSLAGSDAVQSARQRVEAASLDALGQNKIVVIAAFPITNPAGFDPPGAPAGLAGVAVVGQVLDERFVKDLRREDKQDALLIGPKTVLASTVVDYSGVLEPEGPMLSRVFEQGEIFTARGPIGFDEYFSSYVPLTRTDDRVIGALVVAQRSEVLELAQRTVGRTLFLMSLLAAAVAVGLSYVTGSRITRPITDLTAAAERVSKGELEELIGGIKREDEIGVLTRAFDQMTRSLGTLTSDLRGSAAQELELRSRLETILQSMTDGVVAVDENGDVVAVNREAEKILSVTAASALGSPIRTVLSVTDRAGNVLEPPIYTLTSGSITAVVAKRSRRIAIALTSAPIFDDEGQVVGGVAVLRDLTEQEQVEKMKTEFLSNISHELRTPLTPILGYSDILRRKQIPRAKSLVFLEAIHQGARRLERIVEMLVDFSAMEAGRLVPRMTPIDLDKITADLVDKWSSIAPKHRFERKGFGKMPLVKADSRLLPFAIGELIDNAVKFSPNGGRVALIAEMSTDNGSGVVRITVVDQGIGMSKKELSVVGGDFVQADASETRAYGGLGLGLSYVKRIIDAHDGSLDIRSDRGRGSSVTLIVPQTSVARSRGKTRGPIKTKRR